MNLSEENINQYLELQSYQRDNYQVNGVAGQSFYLLNGDFFFFHYTALDRKAVWCLATS